MIYILLPSIGKWKVKTCDDDMSLNHIRTISKYTATIKKYTPLQNLLKLAQKYCQLKIKIIHDVKEDLIFLLRGRDFLQLI